MDEKNLFLIVKENQEYGAWFVKKELAGEYHVVRCSRIENVSEINKFDEQMINGIKKYISGVIIDGIDCKDLLTLHLLEIADILPPEVPGDLPGINPKYPMFMISLDQVGESTIKSLRKELDEYFLHKRKA